MPLLNSRGDVLAGVAGEQGSYNRVPFPFQTFGGGAFLDDDTILVSIPAPAPVDAVLATWRPGDAAPTPLPDNRGANDFAAGGGRFIAWLSGYGCWGSLGSMPAAGTAGRLAVAPDGTIAYIPDRQNGYGLVVVNIDGHTFGAPPTIWANGEQTLRASTAIWQGGALGTQIPNAARPNAQGVQVVDLPNGERWLVYWADRVGFVAQLDGAADGYIIGTTPTFFNHHARAVGGELVIAWSTTAGEGPNDIGIVQIDRTLPREPLVPSIDPPPIDPPPIDPPPIEPPPIDPPPIEPPVEPPITPPVEPPPTEGVTMLFIETQYDKTNPKLAVMKFEVVKNGDGSESYRSAARAASPDAAINGTPFYCITDLGDDEWRAAPGGTFESFRRVGNSLVADRFWNDVERAYVRFCVEVL